MSLLSSILRVKVFKPISHFFLSSIFVGLEMTIGDMLHSEKFNLFDSMSSSELCDPKMDLKCGYKDIKHPSAQVDSKIIKKAEDLSNLEVN